MISLLEETDPEFDEHWIEELSLRANTCFSEISGYLTERENDTLSSLSSGTAKRQVESWVQDTLLQMSKSEDTLPPEQEEIIPKEPSSDIDQSLGEFYQNSKFLNQPELTEAFSKFYLNNHGSSLQENGAITKNRAEVSNEREKTYSKPNSTLELNPFTPSFQQNPYLVEPLPNLQSLRSRQANRVDISPLPRQVTFRQLEDTPIQFQEPIRSNPIGNTRGVSENLQSTYLVKPKSDDAVLTEPWRSNNEISIVESKLAVDSWIDELDHKNVNIKSEDNFQNVQI